MTGRALNLFHPESATNSTLSETYISRN